MYHTLLLQGSLSSGKYVDNVNYVYDYVHKKCFVTLPCKLLCVTIYNFCIRLFKNKLKLKLKHAKMEHIVIYVSKAD